jgi:hypothetical protein
MIDGKGAISRGGEAHNRGGRAHFGGGAHFSGGGLSPPHFKPCGLVVSALDSRLRDPGLNLGPTVWVNS